MATWTWWCRLIRSNCLRRDSKCSVSMRKPTCRTASDTVLTRTDCSEAPIFWRAHSQPSRANVVQSPLHKHVTLLVDYAQANACESRGETGALLERARFTGWISCAGAECGFSSAQLLS